GSVLDGLSHATFAADAWFFDGFAPSANPDMWSEEVMKAVAQRSKPGATAATFTVAGAVRANLAAAGFGWEKAPGFGRKKHMLRARLDEAGTVSTDKPWFAAPQARSPGRVAIIGGGIAGVCAARALRASGQDVALVADGGLAKGASGNPAGLVMPRLDADDGPAARFYRDAFLFALETYGALDAEVFDACGGELAMDAAKQQALDEVGLWPAGLLEPGETNLTLAAAGVLRPALAVRALAEGVAVFDARISKLAQDDEGWLLETTDEVQHGPFTSVVLCGGADRTLTEGLPLKPSLGQVDVFEGPSVEGVKTDGTYVAPLDEHLVAGATYAPYTDGPVEPTDENTNANRQAAEAMVGAAFGGSIERRAALRATTPDRHPIAGPLLDEAAAKDAYRGLATGKREDYPPAPYRRGLFALTGLGSRGLVTAPILGAHVAALITGGVSPLTRDIAELVHPARFLVRNIKRGKA
ncbi:MAG: FAD-dependent 5-carboxymethylaminomethyl-2-thiouridine(34) oxidoreductase MnmC, partial [Parvularculaceae bacterium]|nr:FAD-dependent 5-carboxymethylaminomethyl-2-thiouridine(34) oxidoreductase MnmC [Parvularculaceae bacterium]